MSLVRGESFECENRCGVIDHGDACNIISSGIQSKAHGESFQYQNRLGVFDDGGFDCELWKHRTRFGWM